MNDNTDAGADTNTGAGMAGWRPVGSFRVRCPNTACPNHNIVKVVPILGCDGVVMLTGMLKCGRCLRDIEAVNRELRDTDARLVRTVTTNDTDMDTASPTASPARPRRRTNAEAVADHPRAQQASRPRTRRTTR